MNNRLKYTSKILSIGYRGALLVFFITVMLIVACKAIKNNNALKTLTISFIPDYDMAAKAKRLEPVADYLKNMLKLEKVIIFKCTDDASVIEAMKAKKVDIAYFGQFSYVLAHERAGAEALVMAGTSTESRLGNSLIIVNSKSHIFTMDDIKKKASGLIIGFSDPSSTTGHIIPRAYLTSVGLDPEKNFKQMYFASSHGACILTVKTGKVDVGCVNNNTLKKLIVNGMIKAQDIRIIWKSPGIYTSPIAVRSDLPVKLKDSIRQAYLDLPKKSPMVWRDFVEKEYLYYDEEIRKNLIYLPSNDTLYNIVRKIASSFDAKLLLNQ
jgi:phosphonate transport system substrate-binding protein